MRTFERVSKVGKKLMDEIELLKVGGNRQDALFDLADSTNNTMELAFRNK